MEPLPNNSANTPKCELHYHPITTVCIHNECFNKLMCDQCQSEHSPTHRDFLRSYSELLSDNALKYLYSQKQKHEATCSQQIETEWISSLQKVESYFDAIAAHVKQRLQGLGHVIKSTFNNSLSQNDGSDAWESLIEKLLRVRSNVLFNNDPDSLSHLFSDYLRTYQECSDWLDKTMALQATNIQETEKKINQNFASLAKFCEDFESQCEKMSNELLRKVEQMQFSFSTSKLRFEGVIPLSSTEKLETTNIVELKQDSFAVGTNNGRVLLWDSQTLEQRSSRELHKGKITSVLYMQSYDLLISAGVDKKLCVTKIENNQTITFLQIPIQETIEFLTEVKEQGSFVGILGQSQIGVWTIKLTRFKGKDHYEVMLETKISLNQKAKVTKVLNLTGKDMIAVSFDIGTFGFFSLKDKKLAFGLYSGACLYDFYYSESQQKIFAQTSPDMIQTWSLINNKPLLEADFKIKSQAKGPFSTILSKDVLYCCGASNEIIAFDLKKRTQERLELQNFEAWGLLCLENAERIIFTSPQSPNFGVIKIIN